MLVISFILLFSSVSLAQVSDYLCEIGKVFYSRGQYDEALHEFNKALLANPNNELAKSYIAEMTESTRAIWDKTLDELEAKQPSIQQPKIKKVPPEEEKRRPTVKFSGSYQIALGGTSEGLEWKRADGNLNEEDTRLLSDAALNNRENTFDPRIFNRFVLNMDTKNTGAFDAHASIVIDPWSFTGKSHKFTLTSANGTDTAELELKYWSNTRRTFNEIIFTPGNGDSFALPQIKVEDDMTAATRVGTVFGGAFNIPSVKIHREFQPIRELWFDYKSDNIKLRVFPMAYSGQALTSDDPLSLSNHHIYWQVSPWILRWRPGQVNTSPSPDDFTQGRWDDSLAFSTRDSDMTRLTALRGVALDYQPFDDTSLKITGASPKGLWQDYDSFDNFALAARLKQGIGDSFLLGGTYTFRMGLNEARNNKKDAVNHVWGMDFGFSPFVGIKLEAQVATSRSEQDLTSSFATKKRGFLYHISLLGSPERDILDSKYHEIKSEEQDESFLKARVQFTHMDAGFEPTLASYRESRDDQFWSRHIHFRKPFKHSGAGINQPRIGWDDIAPFAMGDGIDIGRDVFGLRVEASILERRLDKLFDLRNVHRTSGKYVENVARSETTYKPTKKLTAKLLAIYHDVRQTYGGKDPFLVDAQTDRAFDNSIIPDNKSPSMKTFSLGANYDFFDWMSLYGIWEYTNDINAAYDGFPRGIFNSSSFETFSAYGKIFRRQTAFVYNQFYFPLPPYPFYNVFKAGLTLRPFNKWEMFLDFTRNEYEYAGQISDDINHAGIEIGYQAAEKLGFFGRYVYSQVNSLSHMSRTGQVLYQDHHNFFFEARYNFGDDDELTFQFGESSRSPITTVTFSPFGGSLPTLDTQHIYRLYYRRKF
jgi:hypothetical protein